ncbi:MAG: glucose-6-phosphate isomerase [Pelagibacterales bacterium MED-G40]|nr:MAG: hypothetical protein CBD63_04710 [Candidatus Pelagibacter sp. TMED203]PDH19753.1 MAG: glucose-6-phosphate isomerase [Pelagibacterales bacterium MED-G40]
MKNNLLIKNFITKRFYNTKKKNKNVKISLKLLEYISKNIHKEKNIFHLFNKKYELDFILKSLKKFKNFKTIIVIGMGGSTLGIKAFHSFLKLKVKKEVLFLDNLNSFRLKELSKIIDRKKIFFIIISKSGNTLETLTNKNFFKNKISQNNSIVITEKGNSKLNKFSKDKKILHIKHKKYIGGRYSVLSETGMVPAYLMGLKIKKFRENLSKYFKNNFKKFLCESSSIIAQNYLSKKINSIIFFNYCPRLNNFVYWSQQLMAESLGKNGKGILPVLSEAPKDHHSLLQLYLDGPKDKIFYIISAEDRLNKKIDKIVKAQKNAFIQVLKKKRIPFRIIHINNFSESTMGELFSYFILETVLIANLIKVNPFDQPAVEEIKIFTKKNLR